MNFLRSNNVGQEVNENSISQQQYCDFQIPIMLTPI
jgi:hypothetical protein